MKTLIVTEELTYKFEVPDDFDIDKADEYFCSLEAPWRKAFHFSVDERDCFFGEEE
jgi:hypothetical protein